jgi:hypothetical protein
MKTMQQSLPTAASKSVNGFTMENDMCHKLNSLSVSNARDSVTEHQTAHGQQNVVNVAAVTIPENVDRTTQTAPTAKAHLTMHGTMNARPG